MYRSISFSVRCPEIAAISLADDQLSARRRKIALRSPCGREVRRQADQFYRFSCEQGEGRAFEGTAVGVAGQRDAFGGRGLDPDGQRGMQWDGQLGASLF